MIIKSYAATNVGKKRGNNEDNFYICGRYKDDPDVSIDAAECIRQAEDYLFSVCDGMGGAQFGEIASHIAVSTLEKYANAFDSRYNDYLSDANGLICRETKERGGNRIGTTFAALSIANNVAHCYNIGDSRIYLLRDGKLKQLSVDHTQAQMMLRHGMLTEEAAKHHPARHVLTQHLGILPEEMIIEPFVTEAMPLQSGDIFLLCSDGLTDMLDDTEIGDILSGSGSLKAKTDALIDAALRYGGKDNVTVLLVKAVLDLSGIEVPGLESKLRSHMSRENSSGMDDMINDIIERAKIKLL